MPASFTKPTDTVSCAFARGTLDRNVGASRMVANSAFFIGISFR